jgi:hypothetical protein
LSAGNGREYLDYREKDFLLERHLPPVSRMSYQRLARDGNVDENGTSVDGFCPASLQVRLSANATASTLKSNSRSASV